MKESIILIGGGGHCKSCIDVIEQQGRFKIEGIVDIVPKQKETILGYEIIWNDDDLSFLTRKYKNFLITLGQIKSSQRRKELYEILKRFNAHLPVIISPRAYVSKHTSIGEGTIIMHDVLINANAKVGVNCIINSKALIEHDSIIGNHCHISTGAIVNGNVIVGDETFFGSGAVSKENLLIKVNSFIKANSLFK